MLLYLFLKNTNLALLTLTNWQSNFVYLNMKTNFIIFFVSLIFFACHTDTGKKENENTSIQKTVAADTVKKVEIKCDAFYEDSLTNLFSLFDNKNVEIKLGNLSNKLNNYDTADADVYIANKAGTSYLKMNVIPGSGVNQFGFYEIGYVKSLSKKIKLLPSQVPDFISSKNICLGMKKDSLIKKVGTNYVHINGDSVRVEINYQSACNYFLEKYNMPVYYAYFIFNANKLKKFGFGFETP